MKYVSFQLGLYCGKQSLFALGANLHSDCVSPKLSSMVAKVMWMEWRLWQCRVYLWLELQCVPMALDSHLLNMPEQLSKEKWRLGITNSIITQT